MLKTFVWTLSIIVSLIFAPISTYACTTVLIPNSAEKFVAKSFDWGKGHGMLMVNKSHVSKKGVALRPGDKPPTWTSEFGSVTFNQIGREFPLSGINENGLAIEIMVGGNEDPPRDNRATLNELQWIQYQLDNYGTTKDVMDHAGDIRISRVQVMVHYLICDKTASCGVIEFVDGEMKKPFGTEMKVNTLANNTYADSLKYLKNFVGFGGNRPMPTDSLESEDRFVRATMLAAKYNPAEAAGAEYGFGILDTVRTPNYTKWNVVYELATGKLHYRTSNNSKIRRVDTSTFKFSCKTDVEVLGIDDGQGDMTTKFVAYTRAANQKLVNTSLKGKLPDDKLQELGAYPETTKCTE